MRIGLLGSAYHYNILNYQLKKSGINSIIIKFSFESIISELRRVDIIHIIWGRLEIKWIPKLIIAKLMRKKIICHWIGTDVMDSISKKRFKRLAKLSNIFIDLQLAVSEKLVEEISSIGIKAVCIPLIPKNSSISSKPLPDKFTVLSYLPDAKHEFYGSAIIYKLAQEFPDINFLVVEGTGKGQMKLENIKYLGWQKDMESIYSKSTILVRVPDHDGLPLMVLESLLHSRHVIFSYSMPYCYHAKSYNQVKNALLDIRRNPTLNYKGAKYIDKTFNRKRIMKKLIKNYKSLINKHSKSFSENH